MPDAVKNYTSHQLTCNDRYSARYDSSETHGAFPESPEKARSDFGIGTVPRSNSRKRARCEIGAASRCFDGHDPPRSQRYEGLVSSALAGNEPFESLFRAAGPCLLVEAWRDAGTPRALLIIIIRGLFRLDLTSYLVTTFFRNVVPTRLTR